MKKKSSKSHIENLLVLVLFTVFAISILFVLFAGANTYKRLAQRGEDAFATRTMPQYITTKIRQYDTQGSVCVTDFDGVNTLELRETIGEDIYVTRIYCYDGQIRELFSSELGDLQPEDGECVMEAESLTFSMEEDVLTIWAKQENTAPLEWNICLRSEKGGSLYEE